MKLIEFVGVAEQEEEVVQEFQDGEAESVEITEVLGKLEGVWEMEGVPEKVCIEEEVEEGVPEVENNVVEVEEEEGVTRADKDICEALEVVEAEKVTSIVSEARGETLGAEVCCRVGCRKYSSNIPSTFRMSHLFFKGHSISFLILSSLTIKARAILTQDTGS